MTASAPDRMRVLLLTHRYAPEPGRLQDGLAETLHEFGHDVTVLTGIPNYPDGHYYDGYRLRLWQREVLNGVSVIRVPVYPYHGKSVLRRLLNYGSYAFLAALLGWFLVRRPDIVHAYHPPLNVAWPAWVLSRLFRVPYTCDVRDIWPESLAATGMVHNEKVLGLVGHVANWFYRKARLIRVVSPGFREHLMTQGVPERKLVVIPNWTEAFDRQELLPDPAIRNEFELDDRFVVMFAGNMGPAQDLDVVLDAADRLRDMQDLTVVFVGDGVDSERLQQASRDRAIPNVRFVGRVAAVRMPRMYAMADCLLVHLRDEPLFRITIPSKIYTYLAAGRPILAAQRGNAADVVRQAKAGIVCAPGDSAELADTIRRFRSLPDVERSEMADNALSASRQYERTVVVKEVESLLRTALSSRGA